MHALQETYPDGSVLIKHEHKETRGWWYVGIVHFRKREKEVLTDEKG